ncbi:TraB/GumN family protein [Sphingobium sp. OAS761]|uniref:TraB/GumN family protein n=1 Tax=Sphingobium sp. OAS761 TaxID=2817901 RepID=UPI00209DE4DC|nr:TraB/GumN family protein [Sphingobium sp. OAS761]
MLRSLSGWIAAAFLMTASGPAVAAPALWRVQDADTTIYLFGTVHVLKPETDWFEGGVKRAFDRSDTLVLEIVEPEDKAAIAGSMARMALAQDGVKLSDRLTPDARAAYQAAMDANGISWQALEGFNPWMPGMMLSVAPLEKMGFRNDLGVEKALRAEAARNGKAVEALETVEQQIGFFAGLPMAQQVEFLDATVAGLPDMEKEFGALIRYWMAGQPDRLGKTMNESLEATPQLSEVLLTGRNRNWAQWIKARLEKPGTVFMAVGAGHLAGKESVQTQLRMLGIRTKRVKE